MSVYSTVVIKEYEYYKIEVNVLYIEKIEKYILYKIHIISIDDDTSIIFLKDDKNKKIYIENSRYMCVKEDKYKLFDITEHKINNEKIVKPYIRFPRSKDGIETEIIINYMFYGNIQDYKIIITEDYKITDENIENIKNLLNEYIFKIGNNLGDSENKSKIIVYDNRNIIIKAKDNEIWREEGENIELYGIIIDDKKRINKNDKMVEKIIIEDLWISENEIRNIYFGECKKLELRNVYIKFNLEKLLKENVNIKKLKIINCKKKRELDLRETEIKKLVIENYDNKEVIRRIRIKSDMERVKIPDYVGYSDDEGWINNINIVSNLDKIFYDVEEYKRENKINLENFRIGGEIFSNYNRRYNRIKDYENIYDGIKLFISNNDSNYEDEYDRIKYQNIRII